MTSARAFAPATVGNVICGLDVLGLALEGPGDIVEARPRSRPGVEIATITGDGGRLPRDAAHNTAGVAAAAVLHRAGGSAGAEISIEKGLPLASGMGSSAASAAAAVLAVDRALGLDLALEQLLACAAEGERAACGTPHLDNVAAALLGGITLALDGGTPRAVRVDAPADLSCALVHPELELTTSKGRTVLPAQVDLAVATRQAGRMAAFVAGLASENWTLIGDALADELAEPYRSRLVPGFAEVRAAALAAGAVGCGLAGSGPSIVALCRGHAVAERAAQAMAGAFLGAGLACTRLVSGLGAGARLLEVGP